MVNVLPLKGGALHSLSSEARNGRSADVQIPALGWQAMLRHLLLSVPQPIPVNNGHCRIDLSGKRLYN